MIFIGIIHYNIHCSFINYDSALQLQILHTAIKQLGQGRYEPVLVDYCPDILLDSDPFNPLKKMWDKDEESRRMCELSMPAIRENYKKFDQFYHERFVHTHSEMSDVKRVNHRHFNEKWV